MKKTVLASVGFVASGVVFAADFTWMANPAGDLWNQTQKNWNSGGTWVNNQANPNNVIFGATSKSNIYLDGIQYVNNFSAGGRNQNFNGNAANLLSIAGTLTITSANEEHFKCRLTSGRSDGSLWVSAPSGTSWCSLYLDRTDNLQTKTVVSGSVYLMLAGDGSLGPVPAKPTENVIVNDSPVIFASNEMTFNANRTIKLNSGSTLRIGSNNSYTLGGVIVAEPEEGADYSTDTMVRLSKDWRGDATFNPGAGRTNSFGRLFVDQRRAKIASGVTCLTAQNSKTGSDAALYVKQADDATAYSSNSGILTINGGEVYIPATCSPYVEVGRYGQVVVTNGGKVVMCNGEWLNGLTGPGRLIVSKGGEFSAKILRVSQSSGSEVHLDGGGKMAVAQLKMDSSSSASFTFDGGSFKSECSGDGRDLFNPSSGEKWANVHFYVGERGVFFDVAEQNVWWNSPLESGAAQDGGVRVSGGKLLVLKATNTYNGVTFVENGTVQARSDQAIPRGSTLRLGSDTTEGSLEANTYESESPARPTRQFIGRIEGRGKLQSMTMSHITGSLAPAVNGVLRFTSVTCFDPGCVYEVACGSAGCSCLAVKGAADLPQDISGLRVRIVNPENLNSDVSRTFYKILSVAEGSATGYSGKFDESEIPEGWRLLYMSDAVYLCPHKGLMLILR